MPPLNLDHSAPVAPIYDPADGIASARPVSDANGGSTAAAPPHLLWETLESAYAVPQDSSPEPDEPRLARYIALPIVLGLSLALWVVIADLVLLH